MKDMGNANYVLRVKIHMDRFKRALGLSQKMYLNNVLERTIALAFKIVHKHLSSNKWSVYHILTPLGA